MYIRDNKLSFLVFLGALQLALTANYFFDKHKLKEDEMMIPKVNYLFYERSINICVMFMIIVIGLAVSYRWLISTEFIFPALFLCTSAQIGFIWYF